MIPKTRGRIEFESAVNRLAAALEQTVNTKYLDEKLVGHYVNYLDSGDERTGFVKALKSDNGHPCYWALDREDEYQVGGSKSGQSGGWYHVYIPPSHLLGHSNGCGCKKSLK